ncbi:hypothetical protein M0802_001313 [Mischocyttarus mexicanus]|nr:hypothetical protein M0802_001313 [Mischocyttarus mexicanus]
MLLLVVLVEVEMVVKVVMEDEEKKKEEEEDVVVVVVVAVRIGVIRSDTSLSRLLGNIRPSWGRQYIWKKRGTSR